MTYREIMNNINVDDDLSILDKSLATNDCVQHILTLTDGYGDFGWIYFRVKDDVVYLHNVRTIRESNYHCATTLLMYAYEMYFQGTPGIKGDLIGEMKEYRNSWVSAISMYYHLVCFIQLEFGDNYEFRLYKKNHSEIPIVNDIQDAARFFCDTCEDGGYFVLRKC